MDWLFELLRRLSRGDLILVALFLVSTAFFIVGLFRRSPAAQPFISSLFVLALCPFIFCSLTSFARLSRLGDPDFIANLQEQLQNVERPFWLGATTSVVLVAVHTIAHLLRTRKVAWIIAS